MDDDILNQFEEAVRVLAEETHADGPWVITGELTREMIESELAGERMDRWVLSALFKETEIPVPFRPSTDIGDAMRVVFQLAKVYPDVLIDISNIRPAYLDNLWKPDDDTEWQVYIDVTHDLYEKAVIADNRNLALAICRAYLICVIRALKRIKFTD
jgi:hypothetical protein